VAFHLLTGEDPHLVLFSGQTATPVIIQDGLSWGLAALLLLLLLKGVAYGVSLGSGFRGGPIFPIISLGVVVGVVLADLLPGLDPTPAVVAGIAGASSAMLGLPVTSVVMAVLIAGAPGLQASSVGLVAAVVGVVAAGALKRRVEAAAPAAH
jgi:H+/Cl- antiporter ClcA